MLEGLESLDQTRCFCSSSCFMNKNCLCFNSREIQEDPADRCSLCVPSDPALHDHPGHLYLLLVLVVPDLEMVERILPFFKWRSSTETSAGALICVHVKKGYFKHLVLKLRLTTNPLFPAAPGGPWGPLEPCRRVEQTSFLALVVKDFSQNRRTLTGSPLFPGSPGAPTGPRGPGSPCGPIMPSGPGSPRSPCNISTVSRLQCKSHD